MRIAIFSDNFYPELSGISDSIKTTSQALADKGHKICILAPRYSKKNFEIVNDQYEELNMGPNVTIIRCPSLPFPGPTRQSRMVVPFGKIWKKIKSFNPDIIHTHLFFGMGFEALSAQKALKVPLVGTSHTPITEFLRYGPLKSKWAESKALKFVSWYYNHCDFVSAPSRSILSEMENNGFSKPNKVISNPVDLSGFRQITEGEKEKIKKKFNLSRNIILYAGRLAPEKNIDVILRSFAMAKEKIPNLNLVLTGVGKSEDELKELAKNLQIEDKVQFLGFLNKDKLIKIYQASDIFVIMSTAETQSISLMQAMSCGLPSIVANARALPEYVNKERGIVVNPTDYRRLSEKITFLFQNPKIRKELGGNAKCFVQNFSIDNIVNEWEDIYRKYAN